MSTVWTLCPGVHKDYPLVTCWFVSLAKRESFSSAVWTASKDVGFEAYSSFVLGRRCPPPATAAAACKPTEPRKRAGSEEHSQRSGSVSMIVLRLILFLACLCVSLITMPLFMKRLGARLPVCVFISLSLSPEP